MLIKFLIWTYVVFTDNSMSNSEVVAMVKKGEITKRRSGPTDEIKKKKKKKGLKIIIMQILRCQFFVGVSKQPINALYFEFETVLKFYNLKAWPQGYKTFFMFN